MRKLILKMSITLDGFVGGPNGEINWIFETMSEDAAAWTVDKILLAGAHLMGRKTFNDMAAYWPNSSEVFAAPMNEIPKIVFSKKGFNPLQKGESSAALQDAIRMNRADGRNMVSTLPASAKSWTEPTVITGDLAQGIRGLKEQSGKELVAHGGACFAQNLVQTGLVDEFWLLTHPVAIGQGLGLFAVLKRPLHLKLVETKQFRAGAVANIYRSA
ncbi:MAG TPA: dihydrofolate reductase family protein [Candidatus Saccharimonadales bacterium]|nr:dihydrofolate reductase family protein [Candidatus Saccharimonadales bacterium]